MHTRGRRLVGRVTATAAALALAGAAVVMMGAGTPRASLQAAADSTTGSTSPTSGHIDINGFAFTPSDLTIAEGGTLTVTNYTAATHTITSNAIAPSGKPLFNVLIPAATSGPVTVDVPISGLGGGSYRFYCKFHGQMTGTLVIDGPPTGVITEVPKFEQPLVRPPRLRGRDIRIVMKKAKVRVLPHGPRTPMWTFGGTFPGPTIVRPTGHDTKVTFVNRLPPAAGAITVHQHAGHQQSKYDGQPDAFLIRRGTARTYDYPLVDDGRALPAALRFYHDHRMNRTALDNWYGLSGMFLTTDRREARMGLPHGRYDVPLMITDRSFHKDNTLKNPWHRASSAAPAKVDTSMAGMAGMTGMAVAGGSASSATVGDLTLVNGRFAPYLRVQPGRYRFQILNASLFATYNFALSNGQTFTQIGNDGGLIPQPVERQSIMLGPAQRADVVVDFKPDAGKRLMLTSIPRNDGSTTGIGSLQRALMQFRVGTVPPPKAHVPFTLTTIQHLNVPKKVAMTWRFGLTKGRHGSFWSINGKPYDPRRVDHVVTLGKTERWLLENTSDITHYVHLHEELWQTISRDGKPPPPWERGYMDTWRLDPGEKVVVAAKFTDYTGNFMIHCHMLDHEDDGMMATFRVVR
jgi:FtsP/CotA-like multicopper oxidase with cupredoxin domain